MSEISERVQKIVAEHLDLDPEEVTEYSNFIDDLGTDSLDTVELIMAFEDEFGCLIPDDAVAKIATVKDAINFIEAQKAISQHR
jgi:acyl carrier protein